MVKWCQTVSIPVVMKAVEELVHVRLKNLLVMRLSKPQRINFMNYNHRTTALPAGRTPIFYKSKVTNDMMQ